MTARPEHYRKAERIAAALVKRAFRDGQVERHLSREQLSVYVQASVITALSMSDEPVTNTVLAETNPHALVTEIRNAYHLSRGITLTSNASQCLIEHIDQMYSAREGVFQQLDDLIDDLASDA